MLFLCWSFACPFYCLKFNSYRFQPLVLPFILPLNYTVFYKSEIYLLSFHLEMTKWVRLPWKVRRRKSSKGCVLSACFSKYCLYQREREREIKRRRESKLEALMGMWLLKRKKLFQEKQISVYRGSDFFLLLRTGCPLGQLLLPNKSSTPPKCSPLLTPNIPNCAPVTRTMSFHVTPKASSSEEEPHCCETSHPSLESKCLQVKVRSVPLRILKAMLIAWPTVYAPYVRNIWVSGAPGR